jgi:transcriptional regulator with XRE-family HTH domain
VPKPAFTERYKKLRERLAQARKGAGITQAELASSLSRPQSFVSKFERGERRLDVIEFVDVARAIGIDPVRFLSELGEVKGRRTER